MPVSIQRYERVATVSASQNGDFVWSGERTTVNAATEIMCARSWRRGRFLSDELFLAQRVSKVLGDCDVVDSDAVVKSLREGWTQLLRDHLMPDPAAHLGQHLYDLTTGSGLACQVVARGQKLSLTYGHAHTRCWGVSGVVSVGDPTFLRFSSRTGSTAPCVRQVRWESIVCIHFLHLRPTTALVIEGREKVRQRLAPRRVRH